MNGKVRNFDDLEAWKCAHLLVLKVYDLTASFPKAEMFGLVSQMRRAGVSVTSNIAEGFARRSREDKIRFYIMAVGSVAELQSQLMIARDLRFFSTDRYPELYALTVSTYKLLNGLIHSAETVIY